MTIRPVPHTVLLLLASAAVLPASLSAQATPPLTGVVVDAVTGRPVEGVLVTGTDPGFRAVTDADGRFEIELPAGPGPVTFTAYGYQRIEREFDPVTAETPVRVALPPLPPELDGLDVSVRSFRARMDSITTILDESARGGRWSGLGRPRIATREEIMKYAGEGDPEIALAALGIFPSFAFDCGWRYNGRARRPVAVFIDGKGQPDVGTGCFRFRRMAISSICRVELIPSASRLGRPPPGLAGPNSLYIWSCPFLARLADGEESIPQLMDVVIPPWWNDDK